jgi:hypothetical protein
MKAAPFALIALSCCLGACGSDHSDSTGTQSPNNNPNGADPCNLNSGFKGDELCILPPAAGEGIQLHVGPSNYKDQAAVAPYLLGPGEENVKCYIARIPESGFYYLRQENRMRSGSHHMLINLVQDDGRPEGPAAACDIGVGGLGSIPGSQTPSRDFPEPGTMAPEDEGFARFLPAGALAAFQLHYVNTSPTETLLREAWVNVYKMDEAEVKQRLQTVFLVADFATNIAPKSRATLVNEFTPNLTERTRLFQLTAHMHAHSENMTVWHHHAGQRELIYQSFDWAEPDSATYNTVVKNAVPNATAKQDGGTSGLRYIEPGDKLEWSCDVNNTLDTPIRFANEAYTAEMCLLAGAYVGETAGLFAAGCANGVCSTRFR